MSNIYQRVGEALTSNGKITVVAALNEQEDEVLSNSKFDKIGSMDINGTIVNLYSITEETVQTKITFPPNVRSILDTKPVLEKYISTADSRKYTVTYKHKVVTGSNDFNLKYKKF